MKKIFPVVLVTCAVLVAGCGRPGDKPEETTPQVYEPAYDLTPDQKDEGGYSFSITGPVVNETFEYTPSPGSRGLYNESADMTRILARDRDNARNTLMIDFRGSATGTYVLNNDSGMETTVVIGVAGDEGGNAMKVAGMLSHTADGELRITELKRGGYVQGEFKGMMKLDNKPHQVQGQFKVRMRGS